MGKSIKETMQEFTVNQALKYLEGNPEENIPKLMSFVDRLMPKDWYVSQRNAIPWAILLDPTTACNLNCTGC